MTRPTSVTKDIIVSQRYAVLKHMDLRNMDVFQLCACAQFARDHEQVTTRSRANYSLKYLDVECGQKKRQLQYVE